MSKKPNNPQKGGSRLDDTELQQVDNNAKPTHKPLSPAEMEKLRQKVAAVIEKMISEGE